MKRRAALITPAGTGGIAVVRVTGDNLPGLINRVFQTRHPLDANTIQDNRLRFGIIHDGPDHIDQVVIAHNPSGPWVDINCHGGTRIVQRVFMLLQRHEAEICHWRDLIEGKTIEQEIQRHLPETRTALAALALAAQYPDGLTRWCSQAIEHIQNDSWTIEQLHDQIRKVLTTRPLGHRLLTPPRIALAGPPNAGKSTLANYLCGRPQSLVSDLAGTTRDWTEHHADIEGIPAILVDTAGRRETGDDLETQALRHAGQQLQQAQLILLMAPANDYDESTFDYQLQWIPQDKPVIQLVTKSDLIDPSKNDFRHLALSVHTTAGIDTLKKTIRTRLGFDHFDPAAPLVFTERQQNILTAALEARDAYTAIIILYKMLGTLGG